jgi:hypothetical protein
MNQLPNSGQTKPVIKRRLNSQLGAYSGLIGTFIMSWSQLEHELDVAISKILNDGEHQVGYLILESLTAFKKIELFHKLYLEIEKAKSKSNAIKLLSLKYKLTDLNSFKNNVVHANWQTLSKSGFVRTKTRQQEDDGSIEFRSVLIKPTTIRTQIRNAKKVTAALAKYAAKAPVH